MMGTFAVVVITIILIVDGIIMLNLWDEFYGKMEKVAIVFVIVTLMVISTYNGMYYQQLQEFEHNYQNIDMTQTNLYKKWILDKE